MNPLRQFYIIIKTTFKAWVRYPENVVGTILYIGIILLVGYAFTYTTLSTNALPYYGVGVFIYLLIGQQNIVYLQFSFWKEDLLSKPISKDIFMLGNFFGGILTQSLGGIILLLISYALNPSAFRISLLVWPVILLGLLCAISLSYWFAALGLRLQGSGMVVTTITFVFSIFCGILIPVSFMPPWMRYISYAIPYTWAIDLTRYSFLDTPTMFPIALEFFAIIISIVIMLVGGKIFLKYVTYQIKHKKVIVR